MRDVLKIAVATAVVFGFAYLLSKKLKSSAAAWQPSSGNPYEGLKYGPRDIRSDIYYE